ncbi:hypothetical protein BU23DRAFT_545574 [Bimuria novae-zelandiae CBS 107.79]|uniref:Uncharacterized protein n=1 Tax=Bimuria novae-zelandiae CBS 107.79 TaxID=1447943 RepID=A0A6A5ULY8_9PLEO|nr:hypothetical protein BU23DRAFT_545574 [Bimuria novae-zelandiae CBS 107.79]
MDPQLRLFHRQYLQLFEPDFLAWPPKPLLRDPVVQSWLYSNLFDAEKCSILPSNRYQLRVLKPLLARIEKAAEDPEDDEISDALMSHLSSLMALNLPTETTAVQQKSYVTFTCLPPSFTGYDSDVAEPTITLLERRHLISGSLTTGFRTWEAALHLGSYLLTPQGRGLIRGKSILELGAGTGFLGILAAKHLAASHVTTTDGDEGVVEALKENMELNGLKDEKEMRASALRWGADLEGTCVEVDSQQWPYDVVLGADITYDKVAISALVDTLRSLFELRPSLHVVISGAVRNLETFETFRSACISSKFGIEEIDFKPKSIREQTSLFYATTVPLKIMSITAPT